MKQQDPLSKATGNKSDNNTGAHDMTQCPKMTETRSRLFDQMIERDIQKFRETGILPPYVVIETIKTRTD